METRLVAAALLALLPALAGAQDDPSGGEALAQEYCARCHDISAGGEMKQHPPSFAAIARYRPEDQIYARIWFPGVHAPMPEFAQILDPDRVEALVGYILSLE